MRNKKTRPKSFKADNTPKLDRSKSGRRKKRTVQKKSNIIPVISDSDHDLIQRTISKPTQ